MIRPNWPNSCLRLVVSILLCGAFAGPVRAEDVPPYCDPEKPENCQLRLLEGEGAPFTGQLLSIDLAIAIGQKAYWCDQRLDLEIDKKTQKLLIQVKLEQKLRQIQSEKDKEKIDTLTERIKTLENPPFYEHPIFVSLATVGAMLLTIYGISQLSK